MCRIKALKRINSRDLSHFRVCHKNPGVERGGGVLSSFVFARLLVANNGFPGFPQEAQVRCINYREFLYCFAYYERYIKDLYEKFIIVVKTSRNIGLNKLMEIIVLT